MRGSRLCALAATIVIGLLLSPGLFAQATGDFRSFQNGNWNDVNSWERFNGSTWVNPAPNTPNATEGIVTILSGDTITVSDADSIDQLVIDGVLTVNDTLVVQDGTGSDAIVNGTVIMANAVGRLSLSSVGTPDISFASGSVYRHAVNGGSMPIATWGTGSTCEITGVTANSPANGNQSFHNVTWNCPGQTSNLNLGWNGNTIGGDITVISTGTGRWQMCAPTTGNSATVTINGDIIQSAGNFTTNGTSNGTTTITINHYGDINVTGGNFSISRGSQGGTGTTTWKLFTGNFTMTNGTTQNSNSGGARFFFALTDTQTISLSSSVTVQSGFNFTVDTSTTLIIASGLDTLTGTVENRGTISAVDPITFGSTGTYRHARNGGSIPVATWATGSTCEVTGATSSAPGNRAQNFYNFTWNCPGQSTNLNVGWQIGTSIGGTLTVTSSNWNHASTSSPANQFRLFGGAGSCTINNIVVNGYNAVLTPQGSAYVDTVNVTGNITLSKGGMLSLANSGSALTDFYVHGSFTVVDSAYIGKSSSSNASRFIFSGQDKSYTTPSTGVTYFSAPNFVVTTGSSLDLGASIVGGDGSFRVDSGAVLGSGHPAGLTGNVTCTGVNGGGNSFSKLGVYAFNGSTAQVTGSLLPDSVSGLIIDNTSGVTLSDTLMAGDVTFTNGKLILGANVLVADTINGINSSRYVVTDAAGSLTLKSVGSATVLFPIGTAFSYAPVWVTNHGTTDTFSASVATDVAPAPAGGRVMLKWNIAEAVAGGSTSKLKFGWMASQENAAMVADRPNSINFFSMTDTTEVGKGYYSTQFATEPHTADRDSIASFGPFALGRFKGTATSVEDDIALIPDVFRLQQNYPNPFNPSTTIKYDIPAAAHVTLRVYDALGRMVAELVNRDHQPGFHSVEWNAGQSTSGVYFCRIVAGDFVSVKKLILVK